MPSPRCPSGSRKSAVFAEMTAPLLDTEHALVEKTRPTILESDTLRQIARQDAERATMQASGLTDDEARKQAAADAIAAAQLAEAITVPVMPRLVADDVTPEAAATLLAEQDGRLAVLSAEGGIFSILAGRYSGGIPSLEVFLKGHSGDMLRVDRKGRPPEHIPRPALTLGLCVQPEILRAIADMPGFRGRGLLARILYSLPANLVGRRQIGTPPVPEDVRDVYGSSVRSLVLTMAEWTDPAVLQLTPGAAELILDAERRLEPRLAPRPATWPASSTGPASRSARPSAIAGLLHLAGHLHGRLGTSRSTRTTDAGRARGHGLLQRPRAGRVRPHGRRPDTRRRTRRLPLARAHQAAAIHQARGLHGLSRSRFPKVGDLDAPLELLEQHGYIRRVPEPERTGPGRRPSPAYEVHPDLAAETAVSAK